MSLDVYMQLNLKKIYMQKLFFNNQKREREKLKVEGICNNKKFSF